MLKDINDSKDGNPLNTYLSKDGKKAEYATLNGIAYFSANDGVHGRELWRSDGTNAGTYMVKDIQPGAETSFPTSITSCGNLIFFTARNSDKQYLWQTDGTEAGTKRVAPNTLTGQRIDYLLDVNGTLFFSGESTKGVELMKTDGTDDGTTVVKDITVGNGASRIDYITKSNNQVFFWYWGADSVTGLWRTDGTESGTRRLKYFFSASSDRTSAVVDNRFLFSPAEHADELWTSDGTTEGTKLVKKIPLTNGNFTTNFTVVNGLLYFVGSDALGGSQLWRSDGTDPGTYLVTDIASNATPATYARSLTACNNTLFFLATGATNNNELWKTDGSAAGTSRVKSFSEKFTAPLLNLTNAMGILYFTAYTTESGYELWRSDGTAEGTLLVKDIFSGISGASPACITPVGTKILFAATDGSTGVELWVSDGKDTGTHLVKDINVVTTSGINSAFTLTPFKDRLYFSAYDPKSGQELYVTEGTASTTRRVTDVQAGNYGGVNANRLYNYFTSSNKIYFEANTIQYGNELWASDGLNSNLVKDITPGIGGTNFNGNQFGLRGSYCSIDSAVYFLITSYGQLWKTDGKEAGTSVLKSQASALRGLTVAGKNVFFADQSNISFFDLYMINGTTNLIKKVNNAKLSPNAFGASQSAAMIGYKNRIYFQSYDNKMWTSDGSDVGTSLFKNINPSFVDDYHLTDSLSMIMDQTLYFVADDGSTGMELWKTDGTSVGTTLVKDINVGANSSFYGAPTGFLTSSGNAIYFIADDGVHGIELWKSDGTTAGTNLVRDITEGNASTSISNLTIVEDKAVFLVYDYNKHKNVLWQTDGTAEGTHPVKDPNLDAVTIITQPFGDNGSLQVVSDKIFFTGNTLQFGDEIWVGTLTGSLPITLLNFDGRLVDKDTRLNWTAENAYAFSHFAVQRSLDGIHFSSIDSLYVKGDIYTKQSYEYVDKNVSSLASSKIYYRLQLVDKDSKFTLSKVVPIALHKAEISITLQPNPVRNQFNLRISNPGASQNIKIAIATTDGKIIQSTEKTLSNGNNVLSFNASNWNDGVYLLKVIQGDGKEVRLQVLKQH